MVQSIRFIEAGHCKQIEKFVNPKTGSWKKIRFSNTVAIIDHSEYGVLLFDTGYTPRHYEITKKLPLSLYQKIVPVSVTPKETALYQLKNMGIKETDIRTVVLSHFHADHIAGALDFNHAKFVYSQDEYERCRSYSMFKRLAHLYFPELIPTDLALRAKAYGKKTRLPRLGKFKYGYNLFGDQSVYVVSLPGHSLGHIGLYLPEVQGKEYLLLGDAAWSRASVLENIMPMKFASALVFENTPLYKDTLANVHDLADDMIKIPCHCHKTFTSLSDSKNEV